jgi:hypothetical protein
MCLSSYLHDKKAVPIKQWKNLDKAKVRKDLAE